MNKLKLSDRRFLEQIFDMGSGYVLNFSDRTFAEFFENELSINLGFLRSKSADNGCQKLGNGKSEVRQSRFPEQSNLEPDFDPNGCASGRKKRGLEIGSSRRPTLLNFRGDAENDPGCG